MESKRVWIVGAGISGLTACKYLLSKDFVPTVFEAGPSIGGLRTRTLSLTCLQSPRTVFQFSDYPWPAEVTQKYPHNLQVRADLEPYAWHFHVLEHVRFSRKVVNIEYVGSLEEEMMTWDMWAGNGEPFGSVSCRGVW